MMCYYLNVRFQGQRVKVFGDIYLQYLHRLHEATFIEALGLYFCMVIYTTQELFRYVFNQKHLQLKLLLSSFSQNNTQESKL